MAYKLNADEFELEYMESRIYNSVLWENHCHAKFEMIAVLEGEVVVMIEGRGYRLTENQIIIIPPLCYHSVSVNGGGIYRRITALFDIDAIPEGLREEFLRSDGDALVSFTSCAERLREICQKDNNAFYAPLAKSLMIQIFYDAPRGSAAGGAECEDEFLKKAVFYIDKHLEEKIPLADIAKYTSRSKSSFCHLFEEKMNISPKQYILKKKFALASKMISEGVSPTVAAERVGYENYSNFYRMYLKHFGVSPTKKNKQ